MIDHGVREVADNVLVVNRVACIDSRVKNVDNRVKGADDELSSP
jgi:hypothetical protein